MAARRPLSIFLLSLSLALAACSSTGLADASAPSTRDATPTEDTDTTDTASPVALSGYALSGTLLLDQAKGDAALLDIIMVAVDGNEACTEPLSLSIQAATPPADEPITTWWEVQLDTTDSLCGVPDDLFRYIGIGDYDDRLDVPLVQQGFDGATPFGLYLQASDTAPVWIVGIAGTEAQLMGDEQAQPPVVDDQYTVASLVPAPWPEN